MASTSSSTPSSNPSARSRQKEDPTNDSALPEAITTMTTRRSPLLPTPLESLLLLVYPSTLLLGSLYSIINPDTRHAPYSTTLQSHPPEFAPSYFARKDNLFNVFFVKKGWLWVTVSFFVFLFTHPSLGPSSTAVLTPRRIKAVFRWGFITAWWVVVTQWCFGPALIDRGFLLTGGACEIIAQSDSAEEAGMSEGRAIATGLACKAVGGQWKGGHDISGHVFLLVLGSAFLVQEVMHVVMRTSEQQEERTIVMGDGAVKSAKVENGTRDEGKIDVKGKWDLGIKIVVGVAALSWWMLLMTAAFFHTWFEKLTGFVVAFMGIFFVYFIPRAFPPLRAIIGMPGI